MRRLGKHVRQNVVAYIALFFALGSGSAYASHLVVRSSDIVNDEIRTADVRNDNLSGGGLASPDIRPNALTSADVSALTGADVNDNSLTGADVNESTFGQVPSAATASSVADNSVNGAKVANGSLGTAEFANSIPAAHVTHNAQQSVTETDPSETRLAFNTERYDTAGMHDNATNNSRLTAPVSGVYAVTAQAIWSSAISTTGETALSLRKNGNTQINFDTKAFDLPQVTQNPTTQVRLAAGDYVEVFASQSTEPTTTLSINAFTGEETTPELSMTWLAPGP